MTIRILKTQRGAPDGVTLLVYAVGHEYDLTRTERERDLASVFVREGWAEEAKPPPLSEVAIGGVSEVIAPPAMARRRRP